MNDIRGVAQKLVFSLALLAGVTVLATPVALAVPINNTIDDTGTTDGQVPSATGGSSSSDDGLDCSVLPDSMCNSAQNDSGEVKDSAIMQLLVWVLRIMTAGVGIVAVGAIVYAGILYSSASDKQDQVNKAKSMILSTVIGLILYGLMFIILNFLIPGGVFGS